jgi:energy-coupling factor transport system permease protein
VRFEFTVGDNPVTRLDPRVRLLWFAAIDVMVAAWDDPILLFGLLCSIVLLGRVAEVRVRETVSLLLPTVPVMLLIFVINFLLYDPGPAHRGHPLGYAIPLAHPLVPIYAATIVFSIGTMFRLLVLFAAVVMLVRIMTPTDLALAVVKLGLPPEIGMAISQAFSYVPVLIDQITGIIEAQRARGWRSRGRDPISRMRAYVPIFLPTFFRSYVASELMGAAMLSRGFGYDIDHMTELHALHFRSWDWAATAGIGVGVGLGFVLGLVGVLRYTTVTLPLVTHLFGLQ